jgi:hypothetical protein
MSRASRAAFQVVFPVIFDCGAAVRIWHNTVIQVDRASCRGDWERMESIGIAAVTWHMVKEADVDVDRIGGS